MCACRIEAKSSPSTPGSHGSFGELSEYLSHWNEMEQEQGEMEDSFQDGSVTASEVDGDVYAQLAKKEQDLMLAAQLGKALLEKNEYLNKKNEQLTEEIEERTQERHSLRLKLESKETEYESTVRELQGDISQLKEELETQSEQAREGYRAKSTVVNELTQQNERLTEQLKKAAEKEDQLQAKVQSFKKSILQRRSSINEHVHQLVVLREEEQSEVITMLTERRNDLERELETLTEERDLLACNLEESQDRIMMLEKQNKEQDQQLRIREREFNELQEENIELRDKLDNLSIHTSSSALETTQNSLYNELEMSQTPSPTPGDSLEFGSSLKIGQRRTPHHLRPNCLFVPGFEISRDCLEDEIECDDLDVTSSLDYCHSADSLEGSPVSAVRLHSPDSSQISGLKVPSSEAGPKHHKKLKQEVMEVHQHLQRMVCELQGRDWCPDDGAASGGSLVQNGSLLTVLTDLKALLQDLVHRPLDMDSPDSLNDHHGIGMHVMESQVKSLQGELVSTRQEIEKLKANLEFKDQQLHKKTEELGEMSGKMSLQHQELIHLQLERDRLQDQSAGITRDEIIDQTREERNDALAKKNSLEQDLCSARLDMMNLERQLMDAIQQKVELSQQLEQWEVDMHELLGAQMAKQIDQEKKLDEAKAKKKPPSPKKKKSIFSRR